MLLVGLAVTCSACGPASFAGTWQFDSTVNTLSPAGETMSKLVHPQLTFVPGTGSNVTWTLGHCSVELTRTNDLITMTSKPADCTVTDQDHIPVLEDLGMKELGTVFVPQKVRFELFHGEKPSTETHTFKAGEDGLSADFELRFRPADQTPDSTLGDTLGFKTTPTKYGYRLP